ncbi:zinc ribbon domain-containing protein [Falsihalocynthiibacter sp. S25ZX9]|uniref:zinc ribbon domain-containing protein n=1 Tax=Falsihalocynthiibacter sp. S25ZX9 TaxID=3240870 RepID=UPI0035109638
MFEAWDRRRPRFLLSGLIKCGTCGSSLVKISQHHFGCASARNKGTCPNGRSIRRGVLERTVLSGLQHQLMDTDLLDVFCKEYFLHLTKLRKVQSGNRIPNERRIKKISCDLEKLVDALIQGVPAERVKDRMAILEAEKANLEEEVASSSTQTSSPILLPVMGDVYREAVANLRETLDTRPDGAEAVNHIRSLIDRIVVNPATDEVGYLLDIEGDLAGILSLCQTSKKAAPVSGDDLVQIKLVAGVRFELTTFRL